MLTQVISFLLAYVKDANRYILSIKLTGAISVKLAYVKDLIQFIPYTCCDVVDITLDITLAGA